MRKVNSKPITIKHQIEAVAAHVAKGGSPLWLGINKYILHVLKSKRSRKKMVAHFRKMAGPRRPNRPTCFVNLLAAANAIENNEVISLI